MCSDLFRLERYIETLESHISEESQTGVACTGTNCKPSHNWEETNIACRGSHCNPGSSSSDPTSNDSMSCEGEHCKPGEVGGEGGSQIGACRGKHCGSGPGPPACRGKHCGGSEQSTACTGKNCKPSSNWDANNPTCRGKHCKPSSDSSDHTEDGSAVSCRGKQCKPTQAENTSQGIGGLNEVGSSDINGSENWSSSHNSGNNDGFAPSPSLGLTPDSEVIHISCW